MQRMTFINEHNLYDLISSQYHFVNAEEFVNRMIHAVLVFFKEKQIELTGKKDEKIKLQAEGYMSQFKGCYYISIYNDSLKVNVDFIITNRDETNKTLELELDWIFPWEVSAVDEEEYRKNFEERWGDSLSELSETISEEERLEEEERIEAEKYFYKFGRKDEYFYSCEVEFSL